MKGILNENQGDNNFSHDFDKINQDRELCKYDEADPTVIDFEDVINGKGKVEKVFYLLYSTSYSSLINCKEFLKKMNFLI